MSVELFFNYARAREQLRINREAGLPQKDWTNDPIFKEYRFCNVFREDDKTTRWFKEYIREPLHNSPDVLLATIAFRWFNKISTWETLLKEPVSFNESWDSKKLEKRLRTFGSPPWVTGAYMIKTPAGMDKISGVFWCIDQIAPHTKRLAEEFKNLTLEAAWERLIEFPYMGAFMAYEVITDLRHTALLENAPDINTWANPGPGAARGLARVNNQPIDFYDRNKEKDRIILINGMQALLQLSKSYWPWPERPWELREVEHTLCEWDKMERVRLGEGRPKEKFRYENN